MMTMTTEEVKPAPVKKRKAMSSGRSNTVLWPGDSRRATLPSWKISRARRATTHEQLTQQQGDARLANVLEKRRVPQGESDNESVVEVVGTKQAIPTDLQQKVGEDWKCFSCSIPQRAE
jgi:hypothetical protein